ncbi:TPA: hypothetical protein ACH3X1_001120 [Trebouxia sp. C0004]
MIELGPPDVPGKSWHFEFVQLNVLARGFQMLAAMGYQPGRGLGRGLTGHAAPIPVQLKAGRLGLGIEQSKKRKLQELEQQQKEQDLKRARMQQDMWVEHTATTAMKAAHRRAEAQLLQARQVCETLDRRKGLESSEMWPPSPVAAVESDTLQENEALDSSSAVKEVAQEPSWEDWPVQAKLALVLDYLRQTHHYCIFCGCQVSFVCRADLECGFDTGLDVVYNC